MRLTFQFAGRGIDWNANSFEWIHCLLAINVLPRVSDLRESIAQLISFDEFLVVVLLGIFSRPAI